MGIRNLNRYLRANCSEYSIQKKHLRDYKNKTIVIDTSIYLYRFSAENALIENLYLMISLFRSYDITPLFVFDGKPPAAKYETLKKRREERYQAQQRFNLLMKTLSEKKNTDNPQELKDIQLEVDILKRKIVRVKDEDTEKVKRLMDGYGVSHFTATGEADECCAYMVLSGRADACLSDDTDMFMYNCPFILRNLSLINHTVIHHDTTKILKELNMSYNEFSTIMVMNGTDYNQPDQYTINELVSYYREYDTSSDRINCTFDFWLDEKNINMPEQFAQIKNMYIVKYDVYNDMTKNIIIKNKNPIMSQLYNELKKEGFIFYSNVESRLPWKSSIPV
jgi:hypothetical protein